MKDKFHNPSDVKGIIGYYGLAKWWLETFTSDERRFIDDRYRPMGRPPHTLTQGDIGFVSIPVTTFLNSLRTWFHEPNYLSIEERIKRKIIELGKSHPISEPGYVEGRHYTTFVEEVMDLKQNGKLEDAENLLIKIVSAVEAESKNDKLGVAPWYYYQLAMIYRKQKRIDKEIEILERFAKQKHAEGASTQRLLERLKKVRENNKG